MKTQTYRMSMLFDFYGELLTERQQTCFDLYYNEDLSLAEIAQHYGITRQGVRDNIQRAEAKLESIEAKTGLMARSQVVQDASNTLQEILGELQAFPTEQSTQLQALSQRLETAIGLLGKE